jgi:hypothetical protein
VTVKGARTLIDNANVGPLPGRQIPIMLGGGWRDRGRRDRALEIKPPRLARESGNLSG